jgi:hypothetical protein
MKKLQLLTILALFAAIIQAEDTSQSDTIESSNESSNQPNYIQETPESIFAFEMTEYLRMLQYGQITESDFNRAVNLKIGTYLKTFGNPGLEVNNANESATLPITAPIEETIPVQTTIETGTTESIIEDKPTNQEIEALEAQPEMNNINSNENEEDID